MNRDYVVRNIIPDAPFSVRDASHSCKDAMLGKALRAVRPAHRTSAEPFLRAARSESGPYLDNTRRATPDNMLFLPFGEETNA